MCFGDEFLRGVDLPLVGLLLQLQLLLLLPMLAEGREAFIHLVSKLMLSSLFAIALRSRSKAKKG